MDNQAQKPSRRNRGLLRAFLPYFKPYFPVMLLDLFCASLTTLCDLVLPLIVRYITRSAETGTALLISTVLKLGALYVALRVIDAAANYYMQSIGHIMGTRIETDMRTDLFSHLQDLPHSYYDNVKIGQLMSRLTSDLFEITEFAHHCPEEFFIAFIKIAVSFVILCRTDLTLTLIIFAALPLMAFFSNFFSKKMRRSFKESRVQIGELNSQIEDSLSGIRVVKSFANKPLEMEKFGQNNQELLKIRRKMYHNMAGFHSVPRLFDGLMYILVVVLGSVYMIRGAIAASDLIAYLLYVTTLLASIRRIVEFTEQFQRGMTGIERFTEVMNEPVTIVDSPDAIPAGNVRGDVCFENVSFSYGKDSIKVLDNINLSVKAGENIAVVGPSGGGKSTMCSLIPRFYDVTGGRITVDGHDIRDLTLDSLRGCVGTVQQDVYMFSGTVAENIGYGRPGASMEEIVAAAKLADAHEFITQLENGYDTNVGERGVRLSGGQKQRLSIARVFLKNPPILILDEATSALDNESERLVQRSLEKLMKGRTTFTVAHRLTTIRGADKIIVLTDEGIVEQGTHEELINSGGLYAELYRLYNVS